MIDGSLIAQNFHNRITQFSPAMVDKLVDCLARELGRDGVTGQGEGGGGRAPARSTGRRRGRQKETRWDGGAGPLGERGGLASGGSPRCF